jgi:Fe2+ transport system protein FeoA
MSLHQAPTLALDALPLGKLGQITHMHGDADSLVRAQVMGLRTGKSVQVLRRNGRLTLVRVGATCLAISSELARRVEVQ